MFELTLPTSASQPEGDFEIVSRTVSMNETTYRAVASPGGVPARARESPRRRPSRRDTSPSWSRAGRAEALVTDEHFGENKAARTAQVR